uniref:Uncharacterized protein n=1 Tax=Lepeophtheirus salmonis TaxID=72036 RepID=A0A0K2U507_LEPSM
MRSPIGLGLKTIYKSKFNELFHCQKLEGQKLTIFPHITFGLIL